MSFSQELIFSFVPLFVAIDAIGNVPIVISLSSDMSSRERLRLVNLALITATVVGLAFLFVGKYVLQLLHIEVAHFAIAGGLVLLVLSIRHIITGRVVEMPSRDEMVAVVPIGTPLTVGPATLTTLLLFSQQYNLGIVLLAFALNMVAAWLIFLFANKIEGFLGQGGLNATSKVASLLLSAIAVRMIVMGITLVFPQLT